MRNCTLSCCTFFSVFPFDLKITRELKEEQNPVVSQTLQWVSVLGETWIEAILVGTVIAICLVRTDGLKRFLCLPP